MFQRSKDQTRSLNAQAHQQPQTPTVASLLHVAGTQGVAAARFLRLVHGRLARGVRRRLRKDELLQAEVFQRQADHG